jgi:NAD(P)-dependent dehydrogenase (short-subunit alcohol dehydrogenase family)
MNVSNVSFDLNGKAAVITGAAGILGQTFVSTFAQAKAGIIAVDRDNQALER